ncbi:hypothetical protein P9G84_10075 [Brevibacillus centrosporus]|uniref:hypothetical protein n=1 Tax=Brevibacillus centrosporus TaxID=54910 RepID=UPI001144DEA7|nr:hypothetical protein [Brevibacillus centrosporus]MEC2129314.1 hypothetical protein [Brevibacillus centrosporus]GED33480.1 hypothetical protein BCE02nite_46210 [Brevibacillus centrosporus]
MIAYEDINKKLPELLDQLLQQEKHPIATLTKAKIETVLDSKLPVAGVYLISEGEGDIPVYVGRSRTLAQRIGTDHRATQRTQATLAYKLTTLNIPGITCMISARQYMYQNYKVRILPIEDVYTRTIFEVYASMKLETKHNSFLEH